MNIWQHVKKGKCFIGKIGLHQLVASSGYLLSELSCLGTNFDLYSILAIEFNRAEIVIHGAK
jgi:hypothetical protein